jgi:hypothetical protein
MTELIKEPFGQVRQVQTSSFSVHLLSSIAFPRFPSGAEYLWQVQRFFFILPIIWGMHSSELMKL